jgi:phenylalanyl-tRNA synthetase beta subunit
MWEVQIPHLRSDDITREIDLIEEIGRLHGFNNFLTTLPKIKNWEKILVIKLEKNNIHVF